MAIMSGYKAISTKYLPITNTRGSRIKADDGDGNTITIEWEDSLNTDDNHCAAAQALADKMQWKGHLVGGATKNGYCFVFVDRR